MSDKNIKNNKSEIRKNILEIRKNMNSDDAILKSSKIVSKLKNLDIYKKSNCIMIYMDFKNEVNTLKFINDMLDEGKKVIIPYTDVDNVLIIPVEIKSIDDLIKCRYGYLEPSIEMSKCPYDIKNIDLIIVPGVVFDKKRNRIGFGKGYYDRFLENKREDTKAIAFAYEYQVLDEVPSEEYDIKMDAVITEENIY